MITTNSSTNPSALTNPAFLSKSLPHGKEFKPPVSSKKIMASTATSPFSSPNRKPSPPPKPVPSLSLLSLAVSSTGIKLLPERLTPPRKTPVSPRLRPSSITIKNLATRPSLWVHLSAILVKLPNLLVVIT
jgi:hypothetical protein